MSEKVVIKIRKAKGPAGFGEMDCYCYVPGFAGGHMPRSVSRRARAGGSDRMRSALDSLEQMYEDLFGGE